MADDIKMHRLNLCIEVPAIPGMEKASFVSFDDMLRYVGALVERTKEECEGRIAKAIFKASYEWNVDSELEAQVRQIPEA